ncbi:YkgJ family cysteine cluster protein [Thiocystis violacea]|uniref:YkgJ family cysteine cluster protein n=1 Tax=Thiocystis violacea TaxID=13725 RepID=UPI00190430DA|nr:YkgJ family cysteine cluster protein [Thiocystis violacea]MBK1720373.1 zinc/iron-chelating domain-containing protein [Thiocystis violacea]
MMNPPEPHPKVTCATCAAACCRLEVLCLTDTGVPEHFTTRDPWGGVSMARLEDGWCAALDRDTLRCRIYDQRPLLCRDYEVGGSDCLVEREDAWRNN